MRMVLTGSEQEPEDEVPIIPSWILVDSSIEGRKRPRRRIDRFERLDLKSCDIDDRHVHLKLLGLAFLQLSLETVPLPALDEETMYVLSFFRELPHAVRGVEGEHLRVCHHLIQCPLVLLVLTSHLLANSGQEPLCVREAGDPVRLHLLAPKFQPGIQLSVPVCKARSPNTQRWLKPGDFCPGSIMCPATGHTAVEHTVQVLQQLDRHNDSAVDGHHKVV
mmetsp:Transcript_82350/g.197526  ORF Transcript_82350/g.197526 Transcript_82350/m.197526 type:complete len:220 (-) Transcript_82350:7291-7950(-)